MKYILSLLLIFNFLFSNSQCDPTALITLQTRASQTDTNIGWELKKHYSFYNPTCVSQNILLVHLVGSYDSPFSTLLFPSIAANKGFHVVSLKYPNGTAAQSACGNSSDPNCYENFRKEIIEGIDYSTDVSVDTNDCINNRLLKLLQYLEANNPGQNWGNYYSGNTILWNKIIVSGHSQGGGHAALIAKNQPLKRVLMFASPNDFSTFFNAPAPWTNQVSVTSNSEYYGFNNLHDDVVNFSDQFATWSNLGMPSFGDTVNVLTTSSPYSNSHQLYTIFDTSGVGGNHSAVVYDSKTPLDAFGQPLFQPVWEYMLGDYLAGIEEVQNGFFTVLPNPVENEFTITFADATPKKQMEVIDLLGNTVLTKEVSENEKVSVSHLKSGVYFVRIMDAYSNVYSAKIIKK